MKTYSMYWNKIDQKFWNKMLQNAIARKSVFLKRHLCINKIPTKIRIIKISNLKEFKNQLSGLNSLQDDICYLVALNENINTENFVTSFDIVAFDYTWKANLIIHDLKPNNKLNLNKSTKGLWFLKPGTIDFYQIKIGDFISNRY